MIYYSVEMAFLAILQLRLYLKIEFINSILFFVIEQL